MAFFLRTLTFPPLSQITAIPQIVVIDQTGPAIVLGTQPGAACMAGEFISGPVGLPTEVDSSGAVASIYTDNGAGGGGTTYKYLSHDGSTPAIQNGTQVGYNGNGMLQLLGKTFQRLVLVRVDHEAVTTDGGTTKGQLTLTITVAANDQTAGVTNKDIVIPSGARMGSANTFAGSTRCFGVSGTASGNVTIPTGTAVTSNQVTVSVNCFPIAVVEPVVATAASSIAFVLDAVLPNVDPATTITTVTNATILWPNGAGTTLATRIASMYPAAISATLPTVPPMSDIQIIWASRRASTIRQAVVANAQLSGSIGRGRLGIVAADPATAKTQAAALAATAAAIGLAVSDGYVQPAERGIICFPSSQILVADFGNIAVTINSDGWMATTLANFAEEVNPGAANPYIQGINALEPAFALYPFTKQDYINLIAAGVCALYFDRTTGWQFMQGVTAANKASYPTRTTIARIRMADLVEDTLNQITAPFLKAPATQDRVDSWLGEINVFLGELESSDIPALQRIVGYSIDETTYNTQKNRDQGIYMIGVNVKTLPSLDFPTFVCAIGTTVTIANAVQAAS